MRIALLSLLALAVTACDQEPVDCVTDEDCPEDFRCDTTLYEGDCVQRVRVVRCGAVLCYFPQEQCVDNACVTEVQPDSGAGGTGGTGGTGGSPQGDGGADRPDGRVDRPDGAIDDVPEPEVTISAPADNGVYVDDVPRLEGRVNRLEQSGRVSLVIDDDEPEMLSVDGEGRFARGLDLAVGSHTITVVAEQGRHRVEASISVRVDSFVRARNGQLYAGDDPYRFVGLNMPTLLDLAVAHLVDGTNDRVAAAFARARDMGVTVVRTRAYDDRPGARTGIQIAKLEYNDAALAALDHVVAQAGEHGIKLILPLIGKGDAYGGIGQYLKWGGYLVPVAADRRRFYLEGPIREHYKDHVRFMLDRANTITGVPWRSDPTILAWEIVDGLDEPGAFDDTSGNQVLEFMTVLSQVIKGNDANHLVTTGDMGFDVNPTPYRDHYNALRDAGLSPLYDGSHGIPWHRATRVGLIDLAVVHVDPSAFGFPQAAIQYSNLGAAWLRGHASLAALEGKPLVVLNARMTDGPVDLAGRRQALRAWFDEVLSLELSGFTVGNFYPDGAAIGDDRSAWSWAPGSDPADPANQYADQIQAFSAQLAE